MSSASPASPAVGAGAGAGAGTTSMSTSISHSTTSTSLSQLIADTEQLLAANTRPPSRSRSLPHVDTRTHEMNASLAHAISIHHLNDEKERKEPGQDVDLTLEYGHAPFSPIRSTPTPQPAVSLPSRQEEKKIAAPIPIPSSVSSSSSITTAWSNLNMALLEHGFISVIQPTTSTHPTRAEGDLCTVMTEVLNTLRERETLVRDLLASRDASSHEHQQLIQQLHDKQRECDELRADAHVRAMGRDGNRREADKQIEQLQWKIQQQSHQLHQQATEIQALKSRAAQEMEKLDQDRASSLSLFTRLYGRPPHPLGSQTYQQDRHVMRTLQSLQQQRQEMEQEMEQMRDEVRHLNSRLTAQQQSKEQVRKMEALTRDYESKLSQAQSREDDLHRQIKQLSSAIDHHIHDAERREAETDELKRELESRPTLAAHQALQQQIRDLRQRELDRATLSSTSLSPRRGDTRTLIHHDRLQYSLSQHTDESLRTQISEICEALEIYDVKQIVPLITKMTTAVKAVPGMKQFIRDVSSIVRDHSGDTNISQDGTITGNVLPTLRRWAQQRHAWEEQQQQMRSILGITSNVDIITTIQHLRNTQPESTYSVGFTSLQCCDHVRKLFDISTRDEFIPTINTLYARVQEMNTAFSSLRSILSADASTSLPNLIDRIRSLQLQSLQHQQHHSPQKSKDVITIATQNPAKAMTYFKIVNKIKKLLNENKTDKIVSRIQHLIQRDIEYTERTSIYQSSIQLSQTNAEYKQTMATIKDLLHLTSDSPADVARAVREQANKLRETEIKLAHTTSESSRLLTTLQHQYASLLNNIKSILHVTDDTQLVTTCQQLYQSQQEASAREAEYRKQLQTLMDTVKQNEPAYQEAHSCIQQLQAMLDVHSVADVLSISRRLVSRVRMYEEIVPGIDKLIAALYDVLQVNDVESILPAVRSLRAANDATLQQLAVDAMRYPHLDTVDVQAPTH